MRRLFSWVAPLTMICACGAPAPDSGVDLEETDTVQQAAELPEFIWSGGADLELVSASSAFCYLTRISGSFFENFDSDDDDSAEWANTLRLDVTNSNHRNWRLHGPGSPGSMEARARCVRWSNFPNAGSGHFYTFPAGAQLQARNVELKSQWLWFTDSICYLSGLEGTMDGLGEFASVFPAADTESPTGNTWVLSVRTLAPQWTTGNAMCAYTGTPVRYLGRFSYQTTQASYTKMVPVANSVCMLNRISGKFRGLGEGVEIKKSSDGHWLLGGYSHQGTLQAEAECIRTGP